MSTNMEAMMRTFRNTFNLPIATTPAFPKYERQQLLLELVNEEMAELTSALLNDDLVGVADGIADSVYILIGIAHEFGIPFSETFTEVHRSNMTKLGEDGEPIYRPDGKVMKGPNFTPPDIASILRRHGAKLCDRPLADGTTCNLAAVGQCECCKDGRWYCEEHGR